MGRKNTDIMAPDGYLLGGERVVRKGGVILFQRGWWKLPDGFAREGDVCWVHCTDGGAGDLEVAPPGSSYITTAQLAKTTVFAPRTDRPDAKPGTRAKWRKAWEDRMKRQAEQGAK